MFASRGLDQQEAFQENLCNKITKLTKVICQMNIANEANEEVLKHKINEQQLSLAKLKEEMESHHKTEMEVLANRTSKAEDLEKRLKEIVVEQNTERIGIKSKCSILEARLQAEHDIGTLEKKLVNQEGRYNILKQRTKNLEETFLSKQASQESRCRKAEDELKNTKTEAEAKQKALEQQILNLQELFEGQRLRALKSEGELSKENEQLKRGKIELEKQLITKEKILGDQRRELNTMMKTVNELEDSKVRLSNQLISANEDISKKEEIIISLKDENEKFKIQISEFSEKGINQNSFIKELETQLLDSKKKNQELQDKLSVELKNVENLNKKISDLEDLREKLEKEKLELMDKLEQSGQSSSNIEMGLKSKLATLEKQIENLKNQINELSFDKKTLKEKLDKALSTITDKEAQLIVLETKLGETEINLSNIRRLLKKREDEIKNMGSSQGELNEQIIADKEKINNLQSQVEERGLIIEKLENEIKELKNKCSELDEEIKILVNKLTRSLNEWSDEKSKLLEEAGLLNQQLKKLEIRSSELEEILKERESEQAEGAKNSFELRQRIKSLEVSNNRKESYINKLADKFKMVLSSQETSKLLFDNQNSILSSLISSVLKKVNTLPKKLEDAKYRLKKAMANSNEQKMLQQKLIEALEKENLEKIKNKELLEKIKIVSKENEDLKLDLTKSQDIINHLKTELLEKQNLIKDQARDHQESAQARLLAIEEKHLAELKALKEANTEQKNKLLAQIKELKLKYKELEDRSNKMIDTLNKNITEQRIQLVKEKTDSLKSLQEKLEQASKLALNKALDKKEEEIAKLKKSSEAEIKKLDEELGNSRRLNNKVISELKTKLENKEQKIDDLEEKILVLEEDKEKLQSLLQKEITGREKDNKMADEHLKSILANRLKREEERRANDLANLEKYKSDFEKKIQAPILEVSARFEEFKKLKSEEVARLIEKNKELVKSFHKRPSKKEDIELISQLRKSIIDLEADVIAVKEKLKFFQLELVNRDKNYNEVFNYNPMTGVLDTNKDSSIASFSTKENLSSVQQLGSNTGIRLPSFNSKTGKTIPKSKNNLPSSKFKLEKT